jgi:hypothetical protein
VIFAAILTSSETRRPAPRLRRRQRPRHPHNSLRIRHPLHDLSPLAARTNSVSTIVKDVLLIQRCDRERAEAMLSNLVAASWRLATSAGMSLWACWTRLRAIRHGDRAHGVQTEGDHGGTGQRRCCCCAILEWLLAILALGPGKQTAARRRRAVLAPGRWRRLVAVV